MTSLAGKTVLYFEDQPEKVRGIEEMLQKKLGMEVLQAATRDQARECVSNNRLDLIILDIRILNDDKPDEEGRDWRRTGLYFLRDLRAGKFPGVTPSGVPVLVITCVVNTADVAEILEAGNANGGECLYLAKPVRLPPVENAVRKLIR